MQGRTHNLYRVRPQELPLTTYLGYSHDGDLTRQHMPDENDLSFMAGNTVPAMGNLLYRDRDGVFER